MSSNQDEIQTQVPLPGATRTRAASEQQTYVVQQQRVFGDALGGSDITAWVDVATVTVPPRTFRKSVVEKALTEAGITPEVGQQLQVRVLDADSARPFPVGAVQPPPQIVIGESA